MYYFAVQVQITFKSYFIETQIQCVGRFKRAQNYYSVRNSFEISENLFSTKLLEFHEVIIVNHC